MKYLIFEPMIRGHHLEYISHMLSYAAMNTTDDEFHFILNEKYSDIPIVDKCQNNNIAVDYISDKYSDISIRSNPLIKSFILSKCLRKFERKYCPDIIIVAFLPYLLPLLPLFIHNKRIIRGIVFKGPKLSGEKILKRIIDYFIYDYICKFRCFDRIWIVNNKDLAEKLNHKYKTNVYYTLPDPINMIHTLNHSIIREYSDIGKIILFHGGSMVLSKGTLDFINALKILPQSYHDKFIVIFGGKVNDPIVRKQLLDFIKNYRSYQTILTDKFISFEDLCSYISISDYVVIPYKRTEQSSGILGYAALYNVPVIGPGSGLLGKLIKNYKLGITLSETSSENIAILLQKLTKTNKDSIQDISAQYVSENSIERFTKEIFSIC